MNSSVQLEVTGGAAVVTLDSPPLNIFNLAMRDGLIEAFSAVREMEGLSSMILAAAGDHFSAGADLSEFGSAESIHEARRIRWDRDPWGLLWDMPVPTIAALHGVAVGSGMEMAMLCDIRIGGPTTKLGLPETKLGMLPAAGGTQSLTKAVGPHAAMPIVAFAHTMGQHEALERRVLSFAAEDADEAALALATRFESFDGQALGVLKQALRAAVDQRLTDGLQTERRLAESLATRRPTLR